MFTIIGKYNQKTANNEIYGNALNIIVRGDVWLERF